MKDIRFTPNKVVDRADDEDTIEVPINGEIYLAYRPSSNQVALVLSAADKGISSSLASIERFLEHCLEPEAWTLIYNAVKNEQLDYEVLVELMRSIISEFSANPSLSSTDSSPSPVNGGRPSTANSRRPASTRAPSRSRASAT